MSTQSVKRSSALQLSDSSLNIVQPSHVLPAGLNSLQGKALTFKILDEQITAERTKEEQIRYHVDLAVQAFPGTIKTFSDIEKLENPLLKPGIVQYKPKKEWEKECLDEAKYRLMVKHLANYRSLLDPQGASSNEWFLDLLDYNLKDIDVLWEFCVECRFPLAYYFPFKERRKRLHREGMQFNFEVKGLDYSPEDNFSWCYVNGGNSQNTASCTRSFFFKVWTALRNGASTSQPEDSSLRDCPKYWNQTQTDIDTLSDYVLILVMFRVRTAHTQFIKSMFSHGNRNKTKSKRKSGQSEQSNSLKRLRSSYTPATRICGYDLIATNIKTDLKHAAIHEKSSDDRSSGFESTSSSLDFDPQAVLSMSEEGKDYLLSDNFLHFLPPLEHCYVPNDGSDNEHQAYSACFSPHSTDSYSTSCGDPSSPHSLSSFASNQGSFFENSPSQRWDDDGELYLSYNSAPNQSPHCTYSSSPLSLMASPINDIDMFPFSLPENEDVSQANSDVSLFQLNPSPIDQVGSDIGFFARL
jgi:hypothetical protein